MTHPIEEALDLLQQSHNDTAEELGVSRRTISKWSKGQVPKVENLYRLALLLQERADRYDDLSRRLRRMVDDEVFGADEGSIDGFDEME